MASLPLSTERAIAESNKANCSASKRPSLLLDSGVGDVSKMLMCYSL